jgi:hypothetical protein
MIDIADFIYRMTFLFVCGFAFFVVIMAILGGQPAVCQLCDTIIPALSQVAVERFSEFSDIITNKLYTGYQVFFESFRLCVLTDRLAYLFAAAMAVEFALGWIFIRHEMYQNTQAVVEEIHSLAQPIRESVTAVFRLIENPWRLIGYSLFLFLIRLRPAVFEDFVKAAEKGQKLTG